MSLQYETHSVALAIRVKKRQITIINKWVEGKHITIPAMNKNPHGKMAIWNPYTMSNNVLDCATWYFYIIHFLGFSYVQMTKQEQFFV